jgi:hypothetical protein
MSQVAANTFVLAGVWLVWLVTGAGPALLLLRRSWRGQALFLAPVLGMTLLGLVGLFRLSVLLVPLAPRLDAALLGALSVLLCALTRRSWPGAWRRSRRSLALLVVPAAFAAAHAALFGKGGYQLLVGGQDQLQYCLNARYMLHVMHTGSADDVPVPRQDHYVHDLTTRLLPYLRAHRRGAEVVLASTAALTGLPPEEAFPVCVGAAGVALGLALVFVGRAGLRLRRRGIFVLQLALLGSACLAVCHVQGSLPNLLSLPQRLTCLALLALVLPAPSLRGTVLTALLVAGALAFYGDSAFPGLVLPGAALVAWNLWRSPTPKRVLACAGAVTVLAILLAPAGFTPLVKSTADNFRMLRNGVQAPAPGAAPAGPLWRSPFWPQAWPLLLGVTSYYDAGRANALLAQYLAARPSWGCVVCLGLGALGLLGLLLRRAPAARLFALALAIWGAGALVYAGTNDYLRFVRCGQYALPLALAGLAALAGGAPRRLRRAPALVGLGVLAAFAAVNLWTVERIYRYVRSHDTQSDAILLRLDGHSALWKELREELKPSERAPLLIAGFQETVRPFAIVCALPDHPHFLGASITRFWPLPDLGPRLTYPPEDRDSRLSGEQQQAARRLQGQSWSELTPELLGRSVQAVVAVGQGYPAEWGPWPDVVAPRVRRFRPVCDVVYKTQPGLTLAPGALGPLERDAGGPYRQLRRGGPVEPAGREAAGHVFRLVYEGQADDVKLRVGGQTYSGAPGAAGVELAAPVPGGGAAGLELLVARPVKVRRLGWDPAP